MVRWLSSATSFLRSQVAEPFYSQILFPNQAYGSSTGMDSSPDPKDPALTPEAELHARRATCNHLINLMSRRLLIPFLGAGVNLANRPPDTPFRMDGQYLPNAAELSESIARECNYPWPDKNLLRVSWYASYAVAGEDRIYGKDLLYQHLHGIFNRPYPVPEVHRFFARLPKKLADKGYPNRHQLIVTTNYDDLLEQAFKEEHEPYDLIYYDEHGDSQSKGTV